MNYELIYSGEGAQMGLDFFFATWNIFTDILSSSSFLSSLMKGKLFEYFEFFSYIFKPTKNRLTLAESNISHRENSSILAGIDVP